MDVVRYVVYLLAVSAMVVAWGALLFVLARRFLPNIPERISQQEWENWPPSWEHPIAADLQDLPDPSERAEQ